MGRGGRATPMRPWYQRPVAVSTDNGAPDKRRVLANSQLPHGNVLTVLGNRLGFGREIGLIHCALLGPLQLQGRNKLAKAVENAILGIQFLLLGGDQLSGRIDPFRFGIQHIQQGALADVPLFGVGLGRAGGELQALLDKGQLLFGRLVRLPGKAD